MAKINFFQAGDTPCVADADAMEKQTYKNFCAQLLRKRGYKNVAVVSAIAKIGDKGVDIFAEKDGKTWSIQCRRYENMTSVPADAVAAVENARKEYGHSNAAIISNIPFSKDAIKASASRKVELWDRDYLDQVIHAVYPEYNTEYYRSMEKRGRKGDIKTDGKIVIMYILLFIVMFFVMKFR